jgi:hypothetical protein
MFNFAKTTILMSAITTLFVIVGGMLGGSPHGHGKKRGIPRSKLV